ncbi:MAG TPA: hypothetical protein VMF91_04220 [Bryobacteraceae bacterium]|nr:hypothetical protein [Bryobacteraceae bacterium]
MRNLRRELDQAFNVDRNLKCKRLAVTMRRGEYRLIFSHRIPDMVATFWRKHLERSASNLALITAPLFFRTPDYVYLRDIHCNENTASPSLLNRLGGSDAWPSLHYLSSGEVLAAIRLSETFQGNGATLQIRLVSSFPDLTICADQNLILIGSARTHPHIADFQVGLPVILTNDGVEIARDTGRPPYQFKDDSEANYALSRENVILDKYAVLTRFRKHDRTDSPVVTMIGANHGRAAQGVADIVTVSQDLYELAKQFGAAELPERFQAVIKVLVRREKGEAIIIGQSVVETMQY